MNVLCIRCYKATMAELPTLPLTPDGSHSGRCADSHQIYQQKYGSVSGSRFTECHQICQQKWWGNFYQQIYWLKPNLPAEIAWGYFCQQIYWLSPIVPHKNEELFQLTDLLTVTKSASRNSRGIFLSAHLLTVTRPDSIMCRVILLADLLTISLISQQICFLYSFCIKGFVLMLSSYIYLHLNICIQFLVQNKYLFNQISN